MTYQVVFSVKYPNADAYEVSVYVDDSATKNGAIMAAKKQMKRNFGDAEINKYLRCEEEKVA